MLPQLGPAPTVKFWVGPLGYAHDFQFPSCGIEVKAISPTEEDPAIQISNQNQLDCIRRGRDGAPLPSEYELKLFLFCLFLSDVEGDDIVNVESENTGKTKEGTETLYALVESLRSALAENFSALWTKLTRAGYKRKYEREYMKIPRKVVMDSRPSFYEVADRSDTERFPRLIRPDALGKGGQLPSAISKVRYHLRLEDIRGFETAPDFVIGHLSVAKE